MKSTLHFTPGEGYLGHLAYLTALLVCLPAQVIIEKDENSYYVTMPLMNVTIEDAGKYKVTAKNELGESSASISLNFDSEFLLPPSTLHFLPLLFLLPFFLTPFCLSESSEVKAIMLLLITFFFLIILFYFLKLCSFNHQFHFCMSSELYFFSFITSRSPSLHFKYFVSLFLLLLLR